ncbi:uncharacterized protein THITE_2059294 [Thermothielavioides terrestris NRRL 8126]|uniref:Cellobiose dehydrogenase-like cytochrome domain-containing protein n=1 Tax=Thermothielavioides terrestris (strain ATCC 38088 / NRRL 8126) TaxID=578455 RepID=G2RGB4_THETT|nr:uncharacterized protein THITE_2059294 [Thermothielavioides terrestris NRRL 8126]AEO70999.1 hypothetical protein THITE_2059294 [Thermothielavioides terrestris NRRL 8126]
MGLLQLAAVALALGSVGHSSPVPQGGTAPAAKYCDASTSICYSEYVSQEKIAIRVAIPDTATAGNFDVLLQIEAPKTVGWAGVAWGGVMVNNPLTVGWANGTSAVVSSRSAGTKANDTHWTLSVLAQGVSAWGTTKLDPSSTVSLAYAQAATPPTEPANNASRFSIHNSHQKFSIDLKSAQIANFTELVQKASAAKAA